MLLRKMLRDMKLQKAQFISVFLMAFLGVFVYAGINAEWYGMQKEFDRYKVETNLADAWVMGSDLSPADLAKVKKIDGISGAQLRLVVDGLADLPGIPTLQLNVVDENTISLPHVTSGEAFTTEKEGLWLDDSFAKGNQLGVGDNISISVNGQNISAKILGLIMHPEYIHDAKDESQLMPDPKVFGFAYVSSKSLSAWGPLPYNQILITVEKGIDTKSIRKPVADLLAQRFALMFNRDTQPSLAMFHSEIVQNKAMGAIFPIVFFLIAALTMLTTMTRMISGQRTQIGTLKAVGFSHRRIVYHYVSYGLWLGVAGGVLGFIAGPMVIPALLYSMQTKIYTIPAWYAASSLTDTLSLAAAILCCILSSYFACRKELKEVPADSLRPKAPKTGHHTRFEKSVLWRNLGFAAQWNIRDVLRSRVRSSMAIIGVTGCTILLLWGMGLRDSMSFVTNWYYHDINTYSSKIYLEPMVTKEDITAITASYDGQLVQENGVELQFEGKEKSASLTVTDQGDQLHFMNRDLDEISLPVEGIALSSKMADSLGVRVGDQIKWRVFGEQTWVTSEVASLFRTPMSQGIAMTKPVYESTGEIMHATSILSITDAESARGMSGVKDIQSVDQMIASFNMILNSMQMIIVILILAAGILGSVVLYNLGALSFAERNRELATLKVLGFSKKRINALLRGQNLWLTSIGILIAIPLGYVFLDRMLKTMSEGSDFVAYIAPVSVSVSVSATFLLSFLINLALSAKVKRIDMISSLKSVE